jgi:hypothetical protein
MPVYLFVNALEEHIRFRYLHMSPKQLDQEGVFSGRILTQGEEFGKVGSFFQHERATTYHLHFDMQVPTKYGWVFVNPYMTLVAAYERLIGGRGTEIKEEPRIASATIATETPPSEIAPPGSETPGTVPTETAPTGIAPLGLRAPLPMSRPLRFVVKSEGEDRIESLSRGKSDHGPADEGAPDAAKGVASPGLGDTRAPGSGPSPEHQGAVRPVGDGVSRAGARAGRFRRNLYAGHARAKAGHHRL